MLKTENAEVIGWEHAIRGMRNPKNSWEKSDSNWRYVAPAQRENHILASYSDDSEFWIGPNDADLMNRLRNAGTDHRKFMRMITVYLDITAPLYWWKEFDTYKVGTVANSCSTMHKIADKEFTLEDFSHEHLLSMANNDAGDALFLNDANNIRVDGDDLLGLIINVLNYYRGRYIKTKDKRYWWQLIQLLPSSYNQRRTVMLNYEVLANIYKSRRNHKLDEYYTNSFHVPVYYHLPALKKIDIEAPYHALTNAGHISYVELDGDPTKNLVAFERVVRHMKEAGIGYGSINHPVDRDPVCGYNGIINDTCPCCGRSEADGVPFERIRRIQNIFPSESTSTTLN